jgi:hypothetical protein
MNEAQSFGRYIRDQEAFANWLLWKLLTTAFRTFLAAHTHQFIELGKSLLEFLVLSIVIIKEWLHGKAERVTFVCSRSSNQCHIQDWTFHPALFDLSKMRVSNTNCHCRQNSCGNVVGRIVVAFVYLMDDTLNLSRKYADGKLRTSHPCTQINRFIYDRYRIDRTCIHTSDD